MGNGNAKQQLVNASQNKLDSFRPGTRYRGDQAQLKAPCAERRQSNMTLTDLVGGSNSSLPGASWGNFCENEHNLNAN